MASGTINETKIMTPQMVNARLGSSKIDLKTATKSFYDTLDKLMLAYADPNLSMNINGVPVSAKDKYGYLGSFLMSRFQSDVNKAIDALISHKTSIFSLEKKLTSIASS